MAHRGVRDSHFSSHSRLTWDTDDVDPMQSVANFGDCMLVLACGLMLALVIYWNLDVSPAMTEVLEQEELSVLQEDIEDMQQAMSQSGTGYEELGIVYRDKNTGKMYMLKSDADKAAEEQ